MQGEKIKPLTKAQLVCYGLGDVASQFVWTFVGSYLTVFYTDIITMFWKMSDKDADEIREKIQKRSEEAKVGKENQLWKERLNAEQQFIVIPVNMERQ